MNPRSRVAPCVVAALQYLFIMVDVRPLLRSFPAWIGVIVGAAGGLACSEASSPPRGQPDGQTQADAGGPGDGQGQPDGAKPGQPEGWDEAIRLPVAEDMNPDPTVVEVTIAAQPAMVSLVPAGPTPVWTYNGQLPGPQIRARIGDRVIVHFTNQLPVDTTVHWHGLRVPAAMDGMPGHSQPPIPPGGAFDYDFVVPDASTFWYHPHVDSARQVGDGMYAPFIVEDPAEPQDLGDEVVMVLSDLAVADDGSLQPEDSGGDLGTLFGREGNLLLVNGKIKPTLKARPGRPQRWRIINAAKARYFQIDLPGHTFVRIGGDGGLLSSPVQVKNPVLAPAERADLIVVPTGNEGDDLVARWVAYDRGFGTAFNRPPVDLFVVHLEGSPVTPPPSPPAIHRVIEPIPTAGATAVDIDLTMQTSSPLELGINGMKMPTFYAQVGETQLWTVTNRIDWDHPFHMHGFFFQVLGSDDRPIEPMEWKDTVNVPVNGSVRFVIRYDDRPGMWMFHCHILDHAEAGMMGMLSLSEP